MKKLICKVCGNEFESVHANTKYCSNECRKADGCSYIAIEKPTIKTCRICGKQFEVYKSKRIICSEECRRVAMNTKRKKYESRIKREGKKETQEEKEMKEFMAKLKASRDFRKTDPKRVADINAKAKAIGVSYGMYVGMQQSLSKERFNEWVRVNEKQYKERKARSGDQVC